MHDLIRREEHGNGANDVNATSAANPAAQPEELRRLAAALRARLSFHQQCGITSYPYIAGPQLVRQAIQAKEVPAPGSAAGRNRETKQAQTKASTQASTQTQAQIPATGSLVQVNKALQACNRCPLGAAHASGRVLGRGPAHAAFMVVGDYAALQGPQSEPDQLSFGVEEDLLFWKMMQAIQLGPKDVYVTNALKCRSATGETPEAAWLRQCRLHLVDEIKSVRPRLICAMGEVAAAVLLGGSEPVARLRGRVHSLQAGGESMTNYSVMVTYHPRFLLQVIDMKAAAWQDLQRMQKLLRQGGRKRPE